MNCNQECNTCTTSCTKNCPKCQKAGLIVPVDTVVALTNVTDIHFNEKYFLCTNPLCDTVYFSEESEQIIDKKQVNVDIWFKKGFKKRYMICYCRDIDLNDVIEAVKNLDDVTEENIIKYLKKENIETNCLVNNPVGKDCKQLFDNAIEYALRINKQNEED